MEQTCKVFLCKLLQKSTDDNDTKCHMYVRTKWLENGVELILQDGNTDRCYKGDLNQEEIRESAIDLDISYDNFNEELHRALSTNLAPGFVSEIEREKLLYRLIKRQKFDMIYVEVKLREVPNNHELFETAIELIEITSKQSPQKIATEAQPSGTNTIDPTITSEGKRVLLKKFTILLNAKKAKVEELQTKLEELQNGELTVQTASSNSEDEQMPVESARASTSTNSLRGQRKSNRIITDSEDEDFSAMTQPIPDVTE